MTDLDDFNIKNMIDNYFDRRLIGTLNQNISDWNVTQVTTMKDLFKGRTDFNEPLSWDVRNVTDMSGMFEGCSSFNQPLSWDVRNVTDMSNMFKGCSYFNQPLSWDVRNVTDMSNMFKGCSYFNQQLRWNVSQVKNMSGMFEGCSSFNPPPISRFTRTLRSITSTRKQITEWDVRNVTNMSYMFKGCSSFNRSLSKWIIQPDANIYKMFEDSAIQNYPQGFRQEQLEQNVNNGNILPTSSNLNNYDERYNHINRPADREDEIEELNSRGIRNAFGNVNRTQLNPTNTHSRINIQGEIHNAKFKFTDLNDFLKSKLPDVYFDYNLYNTHAEIYNFLIKSFRILIDMSNGSPATITTQKSKLTLLDRQLSAVNLVEPYYFTFFETVFYVLKYLETRPPEFIESYLTFYFQDNTNAYNDDDSVSCVRGILERVITILKDACVAFYTITKEKNETDNETDVDCKTFLELIDTEPEKLIPQYIRDWYVEHKGAEPLAFKSLTPEERKNNLKQFLLRKFPFYGDLIDTIMENYKSLGFNDQAFEYAGGKKRKTARKKSRKIYRKSRKHRKR
jgi:surface protein